ncbi:MAG TPA: hypothetical protein VGQ67_13980 [Candidatus Polarisedimenticolia bacterium]|jgi:hypothetical protein|nr:hypothetical protein [Candidatus Polarisedimenticolia bacterium]
MKRIAAVSPDRARPRRERKIIRSFTASRRDVEMLTILARYHGFSKSATLTSLVRKEFWRLFPAGTGGIRPARGARVVGGPHAV